MVDNSDYGRHNPYMNPVPEWEAAKAAGLPRYNTGKPCKNGHSSDRYTSHGKCLMCLAAAQRRYADTHLPEMAERKRQYRREKPDVEYKAQRKWREKNRDYVNASHRDWYKRDIENNRKKMITYLQARRAKQASSGGSFTTRDIDAIRLQQRGKCAGCGKSHLRLEVDHVIPIKLGGSNKTTNLQLLCRKCNASKGAMHPVDWAIKIGRLV